MNLNISLSFNGNAKEVLEFYSGVFERGIVHISEYSEIPAGSELKVSEEYNNKVMHSEIMLTDNLKVFITDDITGRHSTGNNTSLSLNYDRGEELVVSKELFMMLSRGGKIIIPFDKTFWGAYYGKFTDKFGIIWEVNHQL